MLVEGALPAERVSVADPVVRRRMVSGSVGTVLDPSPHRVDPPCPAVAAGCGGCDLQYADPAHLPAFKIGIVADALGHLGGVRDASVTTGAPLAPWGFRTTVRAVADERGRLGFRRRRSHEVVAPSHCLVTHPLVDEVLVAGRFPPGVEVVVRASVATGERLVVVDGPRARVSVPDDVAVVGRDGTAGRGWLTERVVERWWRVSATSFFQTRPDGAAALAREVVSAVGVVREAGVRPTGTLVDAYAGVGLLAGVLRDAVWSGPIVAVERHGPASEDAAVNLADDEVVLAAQTGAFVPHDSLASWARHLTRAMAVDLAARRHAIARRSRDQVHHVRRRQLRTLVERLHRVPQPRGAGTVGTDLDGRPTYLSGDGATLVWRADDGPSLIVATQSQVQPQLARRLLRARASQIPSKVTEPAELAFVDAACRWLAATLALRDLERALAAIR